MIRDKKIDIAKGIGIILMVMGHSSIPLSVSNFIWAFHMPLFFFLSGWTQNWERDSFIQFVKKKLISLACPFIIYSFIVLLIENYMGILDFNRWLSKGWEGYALWFIPVLFFALLCSKVVISYKMPLASAIILIFFGGGIKYLGLSLPWTLCTIPYATGVMLLGTFLKGYSKEIEKKRLWILVVGFLMTLLISHCWKLDLAWNDIIPVIPLTLGAVAGILMTVSISSIILSQNSFICHKVSLLLSTVGENTFVVVAFSQITIMFLIQETELCGIFRYLILLLVLVIISIGKNKINRLLEIRIL